MPVKKRTFLGLVVFSLLVFMLLIWYAWALTFDFGGESYRVVFIVFGVMMALLALLVSTGLGLIVFCLLKRQSCYPQLHWLVDQTVVFIFPIVLQLGRMLRITQDRIQRSFIEVNNQLVRYRGFKIEPEKLLLLLPHCLQWSECPYKVTQNPGNCHQCGKCNLPLLLEISRRYKVQLKLVTGGTLARKAVCAVRPQLVVAVACERDLSSGIIDSFPLPVYGILNDRPEGPCHNTRVDFKKVEDIFRQFIKE